MDGGCRIIGVEQGRAGARGAELRGRELECAVGESEAEGIERRILLVDVARVIFFEAVGGRMREVDATGGTSGAQRIVIERFLTHAAREAGRETSAGIGFAEQRSDECGTGFNARE